MPVPFSGKLVQEEPCSETKGTGPAKKSSRTTRPPATQRIGSVVDCSIRLLLQSGGQMLAGSLTQELYKIQPGAQQEVKAAGGLKGFCKLHRGRLQFVEVAGVRGGAVRAVDGEVGQTPAVSEGCPQQGAHFGAKDAYSQGYSGYGQATLHGGTNRPLLVECVERLLAAGGGAMDPAGLSLQLYQQHSGAREEVRAAGGLKAFCARHSGRLEFVQDESSKRGPGLVSLRRITGKITAGPRVPARERLPVQSESSSALRAHTATSAAHTSGDDTASAASRRKKQGAGALQGSSSGNGTGADEEESLLACVERLLRSRGGAMGAGELMSKLYTQRPEVKAEVGAAGGVKALCAKHRGRLEWVHDGGPKGGQGEVRLRCVRGDSTSDGATDAEEEVERVSERAASLLAYLELLLVAGGGAMDPKELSKQLYLHHPGVREEVHAVGGFKVFCAMHSGRLEWADDGGPKGGQVEVRLRSVLGDSPSDGPGAAAAEEEEESGEDDGGGSVMECVERLLAAARGNMSSLRLSKLLYQQHPGAREEVRAAGGLKAFCARHSGRLEWVQDEGVTGMQSEYSEVRLVGGRTAAGAWGEDAGEDRRGGRLQFVDDEGGPARVQGGTRYISRQPVSVSERGRTSGGQSVGRVSGVPAAAVGGGGGSATSVVLGMACGHESERKCITGKITDVFPHCSVMESAPGVADVFVPQSASDAYPTPLSVGDTIVAKARQKTAGQNRWRVTEIVSTLGLGNTGVEDHRPGLNARSVEAKAVSFAEEESGKRRGSASGGSESLVECVERLLAEEGGVMAPFALARTLYQQHPAQREEVRAAGGLKAVCARHSGRLEWGRDEVRLKSGLVGQPWHGAAGGGEEKSGQKLERSLKESDPVLKCVERLLRSRGGAMGAGDLMSKLYTQRPEVKAEVGAAAGVKALCAKHRGRLEWGHDGGPKGGQGEVRLRCVRGDSACEGATDAEEEESGEEERAGSVLQCVERVVAGPGEGGAMGTLGLGKQLYLQHPGAGKQIVAGGGLKAFCARHSGRIEYVQDENATGGQGEVRLRRVLGESPAVEEERKEEQEVEEGGGQLRFVGKVTVVFPQCAFMESAPGVADVFIPEHVLQPYADQLTAGSIVAVRAELREYGSTRYRALAITGLGTDNQEGSARKAAEVQDDSGTRDRGDGLLPLADQFQDGDGPGDGVNLEGSEIVEETETCAQIDSLVGLLLGADREQHARPDVASERGVMEGREEAGESEEARIARYLIVPAAWTGGGAAWKATSSPRSCSSACIR